MSFGPADLLDCYRRGVFPMAESRDDPNLFLVDPPERGIMPLDGLHISRSLAKTLRRDRFQTTRNHCFERVVAECAAPRPDRPDRIDTWISPAIQWLYAELHRMGHAHSVEAWADSDLVGGLYGVTLGGAFFGESMFSSRTDASKVALVRLVEHLNARGFVLLDMQFLTPHLASLGGVEISRREYLGRLRTALEVQAAF